MFVVTCDGDRQLVLRCSTEVCSSAAASMLNLKVTQGVGNSTDVYLCERLI